MNHLIIIFVQGYFFSVKETCQFCKFLVEIFQQETKTTYPKNQLIYFSAIAWRWADYLHCITSSLIFWLSAILRCLVPSTTIACILNWNPSHSLNLTVVCAVAHTTFTSIFTFCGSCFLQSTLTFIVPVITFKMSVDLFKIYFYKNISLDWFY